MSTIVTLEAIWLNLVSDPSQYVVLDLNIDLSRAKSQDGNIVPLAGGRLRVVRKAGRSRQWSFPVRINDPAKVAFLEDHVGETFCARDHRGHKVFVVYLSVDMAEHDYADNAGADTSLTLSELSFSEAV